MNEPKAEPREEPELQHETARVYELVEGLLQKQSALSLTERLSFEQQIDDKIASILDKDKNLGRIADNLCRLKNQYLFLYQIVERKLTRLLNTTVRALGEDDHLLVALCARTFVERAASLSYLIEQTKRTLERLGDTKEPESISEAVEELYTIYKEGFYGARFFKNDGLVDSHNVMALVDEYLSPSIEGIREYYDYLSDFVHPSFDSNVLASSSGLGEGISNPSFEEKKEVIGHVLRITGIILEYVDHLIEDLVSAGMIIDAYVQKALQATTTMATLFAEPPTTFAIEDTSKQAATFFNKEGKVWLKLGDGTSFETPLKSIGEVTPEQEVAFSTKEGKIWLNLDDGTSFETPLESVTSKQAASFFTKAGKVWLKLDDGTSFETPVKSINDVTPEQEVTLSSKQGTIWLTLDDTTTFETPLKSIGRQVVTFFTRTGKVWLRLGDGTSFETPLKSIGDVTPKHVVILFTKKGKVWLRLDRDISFETPLTYSGPKRIAIFFNKHAKVWLRT